MKKLLWVAGAFSTLAWSACQCGNTVNACDAVCTPGTRCDESTGKCVVIAGSGGGFSSAGGGAAAGGGSAVGGGSANDGGTGGGAATGGGSATGGGAAAGGGSAAGGGAAMGNCNPMCSGNTPVCDPQSNMCVTCNAQTGCYGSTPYCDTSVLHGECVGCRGQADCTGVNQYCDQITHTCQMYMGTGGGGGSSTGGGAGGGAGGGTTNTVTWNGGGTTHCLPFDGGTNTCTSECGRGFTCVNGQCILNGSAGPIQVTLRFPNEPEDVDLHVIEPVGNGADCEIYYGNTNVDAGFPNPFACGAYGWLDLDSNPACNIDNVDIENVIYSPGTPIHTGTYTVRVDYYEDCSAISPVQYEVEVRALGQSRFWCSQFQPGTDDSGGQGSGATVTTFDIQ
ncbi:MAG: hypothetical protein QM723_28660 [Myxococcaceae bacterium]